MADIRSQPEEDSGTDRTLKTILLGDFYKNPTFSGLAVRATISVVPGLDQLADVHDTAAWVLLCRDEGLENSEVRLNGLLLGIGWIPVIGSVGKGVLKVLSSSAAGKSVAKLVEHLNFLGKGNGVKWLKEFSGDLPALAKQAASKMKAILDELHDMLSKLKELVPQKLTQKLDEWRSAVMRVRNQIDEMFAKAADDLKAQLDEALAKFQKKELDVPSSTKTEVARVKGTTPPPGSNSAPASKPRTTPKLSEVYSEKDLGPLARERRGTTYRGDGRDMQEVFDNGLSPPKDWSPRGSNTFKPISLEEHIVSDSKPASQWVSTSKSKDIAQDSWYSGLQGNVYVIEKPGGVDVNKIFGEMSPNPKELEVAFSNGIESRYINGAYEVYKDWDTGQRVVGKFVPNPNFNL